MKKIIKGYYYFFYQLFQFYQHSTFVWWSDWKAELSMSILEIWFIISLFGYLSILSGKVFFNKEIILIVALVVILINSYIFIFNQRWKVFFKEFKQLSKKANLIGGIIVWIIISMIFAFLISMFYCLSRANLK